MDLLAATACKSRTELAAAASKSWTEFAAAANSVQSQLTTDCSVDLIPNLINSRRVLSNTTLPSGSGGLMASKVRQISRQVPSGPVRLKATKNRQISVRVREVKGHQCQPDLR